MLADSSTKRRYLMSFLGAVVGLLVGQLVVWLLSVSSVNLFGILVLLSLPATISVGFIAGWFEDQFRKRNLKFSAFWVALISMFAAIPLAPLLLIYFRIEQSSANLLRFRILMAIFEVLSGVLVAGILAIVMTALAFLKYRLKN